MNNELVSTDVKFEVIENGFLLIGARIYKEGVYLFSGQSLGDNREYVSVYYPFKEFANNLFLKKLSVVPVIIGHHEVNSSNGEDIVGHVVGDPTLSDGSIIVDLLIEENKNIQRIQQHDLRDVSLLFDAVAIPESGIWEGKKYDYRISEVKIKHIALLPPGQGRMGTEVRLFNSKGGEMEESKDDAVQKFKAQINELLKRNKELQEQNESLKNPKNLHEKLIEAQEDNNKAAVLDEAVKTSIANSGLFGADLYKAALQSMGVSVEGLNDQSLKAAFDASVIIAKKMNENKNSKSVSLANSGSPIKVGNNIFSQMCEDDRIEAMMRAG